MKALVYLGPRRMELREADDPVAARGEVVVETIASAVCGSDLHGFREASPRRIPPLIMGHETVGTVSSAGDGVDSALAGRRVVLKPILACGSCEACATGRTNLCANGRLVGRDVSGGFAERFAVPAAAVVEVPRHVSDDAATLVEPVANAVHVTSRAVGEGDDVLVLGSGPMGVLMARMALDAGAGRVFVTDQIASRLELARAQGAVPLAVDSVDDELAAATGGRGVDVAIDAVGVAATWALALRAVRAGGRIDVLGLGAASTEVDAFAVIAKEATIAGSYGWTDADFARALAVIERGDIETAGWFTHASLADGQRAFEDLVDGSERFKVVLTP